MTTLLAILLSAPLVYGVASFVWLINERKDEIVLSVICVLLCSIVCATMITVAVAYDSGLYFN